MLNHKFKFIYFNGAQQAPFFIAKILKYVKMKIRKGDDICKTQQ